MRTIAGLLLLLLPLAAGCVEFERQTLLLRWDRETDTLHLRLIYRGIYAGEDDDKGGPKDVAKALGQLRETVEKGTRFYVLDNWPFAVDVGPPEEGEKDEPGDALFRRHATVRNGRFFRDGEGRLCAWQDVEIRQATAFFAEFNRLAGQEILDEWVPKADAESGTALAAAVESGHDWVRLDDAGLSFTTPLSQEGFAAVKESVLSDLAGDDAEVARRVLAQNPLSWIQENGRLTLRLAARNGVVRFEWWNKKGPYVPNLLEGEPKPELPLPIDPDQTAAKLISSFSD